MTQRVLLVEGRGDVSVVRNLVPSGNFTIVDAGGVWKLLDRISSEVKRPQRTVLGIVVDADGDPPQRWSKLADQLLSARMGIQLPAQPAPGGTIVPGRPDGVPRRPRVGIWVMPNNKSTGALEHFVARMIPRGDPVWPRAQRYIRGIPRRHRKFKPSKEKRAQLFAWYATREEPLHPGLAIEKGDLRVDGRLAKSFANWLDRLFA